MRALIWQEQSPSVQGGAESWITDTAAALRLRGHSVAWLYSDQIKRAVDEFRPDVVVLGTLHNYVGLEPAAWLADQGVPGAWFIHDYWPFCSDRMLMQEHNQSDRPCEAAQGECRNSCGGRHLVPEVVNRFYVLTGCEGAAAIMRRHGVNVRAVVEEGIDTDLFRPDPAKREPLTAVYASAAWNAPWKGMHVVTQALQGTGLQLRLLTGLKREQVAAELQKASIFVFPSLYEEIWGLALTEAMACGCAVVASDVAGARAQVEQGKTGLLVPAHASDQLSRALQWLLLDDETQQTLGEAARAHVERDHGLAALGERWEKTLEMVLRCAV